MAQFPILRLTRAGQDLVGMSQGGGKLIFVRVELGDGQLEEGESVEMLHALKRRVMQLPLQGYLNEGNGKARLRFVVDNSSLTAGFFNREIGIVAKMEGGDEQLYAYTNAGNYADYIPSKDTPIDSEIIDLHILIGNASHVVLETQNGAYATKIELEEHRTAAELDHPEKSVKRKHLADNVYTLPAPEATNAARFVGGDHKVRDVTPGSIGAYSKGEVDSRVNTKVNKSGDTMTGALNFANNLGTCLYGTSADNDFWRIYAGVGDGGSNDGYLSLDTADDGSEIICVRQFTGNFNSQVRCANLLGRDGATFFPVSVTAPCFYANDWFRCKDNCGIHWEKYGGGWYMADTTWIRAYNDKNIYTAGKIKADSGFEGTATNANKLENWTLQNILDEFLNVWHVNRAYAVSDIAYHKNLPSWARLECVVAGTTGNNANIFSKNMKAGQYIQDGGVRWIVDDMRDGNCVGSVAGSLYLPDGYIKANGATVQRADYPRLVALADKHNLWTNDTAANAGMFGRGNGSSTFVLPNWIDRMAQFAAQGGSTLAAGLPNITGGIEDNLFRTEKFGGGYGALIDSVGGKMTGFGAGALEPTTAIHFDASKSNPIYGRSHTVQPAAIQLIPIIKY